MSKEIKDKISEVEKYISVLKTTASKHLNNKSFERYRNICDSILNHEKQLAQLKRELGVETNLKVVRLCRTAQLELRRGFA